VKSSAATSLLFPTGAEDAGTVNEFCFGGIAIAEERSGIPSVRTGILGSCAKNAHSG